MQAQEQLEKRSERDKLGSKRAGKKWIYSRWTLVLVVIVVVGGGWKFRLKVEKHFDIN